MNVNEIKTIARERGIKTGNLKKSDLIKTIQRDEGNGDCFGMLANGPCDQTACLWRTDCQLG